MPPTDKIFNRPIIIVLAFAFAFIISSCSAPAEKLNKEGNQAFSEEAYLEALELYQSAQIESPELAEPYFNAANTFYRQGNFPAALQQMEVAFQYIDKESLAESSFYNLGNTLYSSQDLAHAVEAYKQSLLLNPHDQDAKYNLELALQQQQQQEQQQQNQEQQEQSQSEDQNDSESESGEDEESEDNQGDQDPQNGNQQQEDPASESNESQDQGEANDEQQGDGGSQTQPGDEEQDQPAQMPPPGQRMTEEQAHQLLAAIASEMETLQEHLGQYLFARQAPPLQDW